MKATQIAIAAFLMISSITSQCVRPRIAFPLTNICFCPFRLICFSPKTLDANCRCGCLPQTCVGGEQVNQNTCKCECQTSCTLPQVRKTGECGCECQNKVDCGIFRRFDENTCSCVCKQVIPCLLPQLYFNTDTCFCDFVRQLP